MSIARLMTVAVVFGFVLSMTPAVAQTSERVWDQGSVWAVSYIKTKPGMFNAYVKDLSHVWKRFLDEEKKTGDVLSYKMLSVQNPRDEEPDLILMVEYKNLAVFDQGPARFEELSKKLMGSTDLMQTANINREELRELRGSVMTREIHFQAKP